MNIGVIYNFLNYDFYICEDSLDYNVTKNKYVNLCRNVEYDVKRVISQTVEEARENPTQFVKIKDNTLCQLVSYGIDDLPMLERVGHVRENILTERQAKRLGFSVKNKHYHGLGVKTYLSIMNSMDSPIAIYQYTDKGKYNSNNFIVIVPVKIKGFNYIVPVEIDQTGRFDNINVKFNRIKSAYLKDNSNYIERLLKEGKIKEIVTQSNSEQVSLGENNIP